MFLRNTKLKHILSLFNIFMIHEIKTLSIVSARASSRPSLGSRFGRQPEPVSGASTRPRILSSSSGGSRIFSSPSSGSGILSSCSNGSGVFRTSDHWFDGSTACSDSDQFCSLLTFRTDLIRISFEVQIVNRYLNLILNN